MIEDIKARVRDIPGTESLTMYGIGGRQEFGFNGLISIVPMNATDNEIEDAIRATYDLAKYGRNPIEKSPTPLPAVNLTEPKTMDTPKSPTGFVPGEISGLFKTLRARKDAMVADIMATGNEVAATLATGEQMAQALKADGEALKAEFGLLTNNPPA